MRGVLASHHYFIASGDEQGFTNHGTAVVESKEIKLPIFYKHGAPAEQLISIHK